MSKPDDIRAGAVFEVEYPFVRTTYTEYTEDGPSEVPSWRPGVEYELRGPDGDSEAVFDGIGKQILAVVDVHKPGHYPARVFYTVRWVSPDANTFGKGNLKILTLDAFRRRTRGFMSHDHFFSAAIRKGGD